MTAEHSHWPGEYTYCPKCTTELEDRQIGGSVRRACPNCDYVHWRNPGVGAAVVIFDKDDRLLLVKRAEGATRPGYWSIPAGFVNYGEEIREAAARELWEETGLEADVGEPVFVASNFHDPEKLTVGIWFEGTVTGGNPSGRRRCRGSRILRIGRPAAPRLRNGCCTHRAMAGRALIQAFSEMRQ